MPGFNVNKIIDNVKNISKNISDRSKGKFKTINLPNGEYTFQLIPRVSDDDNYIDPWYRFLYHKIGKKRFPHIEEDGEACLICKALSNPDIKSKQKWIKKMKYKDKVDIELDDYIISTVERYAMNVYVIQSSNSKIQPGQFYRILFFPGYNGIYFDVIQKFSKKYNDLINVPEEDKEEFINNIIKYYTSFDHPGKPVKVQYKAFDYFNIVGLEAVDEKPLPPVISKLVEELYEDGELQLDRVFEEEARNNYNEEEIKEEINKVIEGIKELEVVLKENENNNIKEELPDLAEGLVDINNEVDEELKIDIEEPLDPKEDPFGILDDNIDIGSDDFDSNISDEEIKKVKETLPDINEISNEDAKTLDEDSLDIPPSFDDDKLYADESNPDFELTQKEIDNLMIETDFGNLDIDKEEKKKDDDELTFEKLMNEDKNVNDEVDFSFDDFDLDNEKDNFDF